MRIYQQYHLKRMYRYYSALLLVLFTIGEAYAQNSFEYAPPAKTFIKHVNVNVLKQDYIDAVRYLPKGYKKDGSVDYTFFLQKAITENEKVIMPNFPVLINYKGLVLKDRSELYFQRKSEIILKANDKTNYSIIHIEGVNDVRLYSPKLVGDRNTHIGTKGEWGMGINIINSNNVQVINADISNCWGDGIYLGAKIGGGPNRNIVIKGGIINNNRRNGISVISASGLKIEGVMLANSNGTLPMAGLDFEPNNNWENLDKIIVSNTISYNNGDTGFLIYLGAMLGKIPNSIDILLVNCKDIKSKQSISVPGLRNDYSADIKKMTGKIVFKNFTSEDSEIVFAKSSGNYTYTPAIEIKGLKAKLNRRERDLLDLKQWMYNRKMIDDNR